VLLLHAHERLVVKEIIAVLSLTLYTDHLSMHPGEFPYCAAIKSIPVSVTTSVFVCCCCCYLLSHSFHSLRSTWSCHFVRFRRFFKRSLDPSDACSWTGSDMSSANHAWLSLAKCAVISRVRQYFLLNSLSLNVIHRVVQIHGVFILSIAISL